MYMLRYIRASAGASKNHGKTSLCVHRCFGVVQGMAGPSSFLPLSILSLPPVDILEKQEFRKRALVESPEKTTA